MRLVQWLYAATALAFPSVAQAGPDKAPPPLPSEIRLSDDEKEKVLEAAASRHEQVTARAGEAKAAGNSAPPFYGDIGFSIGTGGYRSAHGTAIVPLEGEGVAIISLGSTDFGSRRDHFESWWR
jgi:hypothetical protein